MALLVEAMIPTNPYPVYMHVHGATHLSSTPSTWILVNPWAGHFHFIPPSPTLRQLVQTEAIGSLTKAVIVLQSDVHKSIS